MRSARSVNSGTAEDTAGSAHTADSAGPRHGRPKGRPDPRPDGGRPQAPQRAPLGPPPPRHRDRTFSRRDGTGQLRAARADGMSFVKILTGAQGFQANEQVAPRFTALTASPAPTPRFRRANRTGRPAPACPEGTRAPSHRRTGPQRRRHGPTRQDGRPPPDPWRASGSTTAPPVSAGHQSQCGNTRKDN